MLASRSRLNMLSAEEGAAEADAIEAADEPAFAPALDGMGVACGVKRGVKAQDFGIDPAFGPARHRRGAGPHDIHEGAVGGDSEAVAAHRAGEALGDVKAVERDDAAPLRRDPEQVWNRRAAPPWEKMPSA